MNEKCLPYRLKMLRKSNSESQESVGKKLYLSQTIISQIENGNRDVTAVELSMLAQYYNVSADYLLGLTDCKATTHDMRIACEMTGLNEEEIEIIRYITSVPFARAMLRGIIYAVQDGVSHKKLEKHLKQKGKESND
jgi:transcriptional regulator with XRE-family HTH domain